MDTRHSGACRAAASCWHASDYLIAIGPRHIPTCNACVAEDIVDCASFKLNSLGLLKQNNVMMNVSRAGVIVMLHVINHYKR